MNLPAKFKVCISSTHYEDMKGDTKYEQSGGLGSMFLEITKNVPVPTGEGSKEEAMPLPRKYFDFRSQNVDEDNTAIKVLVKNLRFYPNCTGRLR